MPTTDVYSTSGKKLSKISLPEDIFAVEINKKLIAQAVKVYLSNQRQATAKTKSRSEINFSKRKIWKQKGTGRARHGAKSAPIFVKGGRAHGPTGEQNYKLKLSQTMKKKALASALTQKLKDNQLIVIKGLEKIKGKTKEMNKIVVMYQKQISSKNKKKKIRISIILPKVWENVIRAGRNIPGLDFMQAKQLNTYEVLNGGMLVFAKESIEALKESPKSKVQSPKSKVQNKN